jgi:hypothetical protein
MLILVDGIEIDPALHDIAPMPAHPKVFIRATKAEWLELITVVERWLPSELGSDTLTFRLPIESSK